MLSGKIAFVDLDGKGTEQRGSHPAIILKYFSRGDLAIVIPLTSNLEVLEKFPCTHLIRANEKNGLEKDSVAQLFQIKCCHRSRFSLHEGKIRILGEISHEEQKIINDVIKSEFQFS